MFGVRIGFRVLFQNINNHIAYVTFYNTGSMGNVQFLLSEKRNFAEIVAPSISAALILCEPDIPRTY